MRFNKILLVLLVVTAAAGIVYADAAVEKNSGAASASLWGKSGTISVTCINEVGPDGTTTNASCHGSIPAESAPDETVVVSGFACDTDVGVTNDTHLTATKSGQLSFTCKVH